MDVAVLRKMRSKYIEPSMMEPGPLLHSPKGALESCDCPNESWAAYGLWKIVFLRFEFGLYSGGKWRRRLDCGRREEK